MVRSPTASVNLKIKTTYVATGAKHKLEEKQSPETHERKERGIQRKMGLFHEDEECWVCDEPLQERLCVVKA